MIRCRHTAIAGVLLSLSILSACSKQAAKPAELPTVSAPQAGVMVGTEIVPPNLAARPSSLIGLYTSLFLADQGGFFPVHAAAAGVLAQVTFHGTPSPGTMDDTYSLLQEFGTVLQVDVNDILNRSDNRAQTLDEYLTGLHNITVRARQRSSDLSEYVQTLQAQDRAGRQAVSDLQTSVQKALQAKDYATLATLQQDMTTEQTKLAQIESNLKSQTVIQNAFKTLLQVSQQRTDAITQNREVLVAGLKVVNVPGIQDLGILEGLNGKSGGSFGGSVFGNIGF